MREVIQEFEVASADLAVDPNGSAVLTAISDKGRLALHMRRAEAELLVERMKRELERVDAPSRRP